jgi:BolA family transcriptional regulator, general stress-responsive regulator
VNARISMIEERLRSALAPLSLDVVDESAQHAGHAGARSGGGHYALTIVATQFAGMSPVQRHRMIYQALGDAMRQEIHALSIRAYTPDEL